MPDYAGYLDAASGAPLHPVAREALLASLDDGWADPARLHGAGRRAAALLDASRESLADSLGVRADELSFAPSGTVALHSAVLGCAAGNRRPSASGPPRIVFSAVEHSAVLHAVGTHSNSGGRATSVAVDRLGRVDLDALIAESQGPDVIAVALQAANHEVGTSQPVAAAALAITAPLIMDATQTLGHAPLPHGWSVLAGDARAWGGGTVGLLVVRTGVRWRSPYPEDEREGGRLPGVPNLPAIVAAAASFRAVEVERDAVAARHREQTERIRQVVATTVADVEVLGDPHERLPHLVTFSCLYVDGETVLHGLDRRGFAVSSGSSCTSSTLEPSHVLVAMGALTSGNIRVSLHAGTTDAEIGGFLAALPDVVSDVRAELGAHGL